MGDRPEGATHVRSYAERFEASPTDRVARHEVRRAADESVSLVRVWADRAFPEPAAPELRVHVLVRGSGGRGRTDTGAGRYAWSAVLGTFGVTPAGVDCDSVSDAPVEMLVVALPNDAALESIREVTQTDFGGFGPLHARAWNDARVEGLVHALWRATGDPASASARLVIDGTRIALLGELMRLDGTPTPRPGDRSRLSASTLARIDEFLRAHLHERIGVEELAALAGCTRHHFSRLFRQSTGETPHACLTRLRIERASVLLVTTGLTINLIAQRVGFSNGQNLARAFRRHRGTTPTGTRAG